MTLGLSLEAFTRLHVALSLMGIVSGLVVLFGLIAPLAVLALVIVLTVVAARRVRA